MAKVFLEEGILSGIASAIREKNGESTSYYPGEFAEKIKEIPRAIDLKNLIDGSLSEITLSNVTRIKNFCFYYRYSLRKAVFPDCLLIGNNAFEGDSNLIIVSFPKVSHISNYAFNGCELLSEATFPMCTYIGLQAFKDCYNLLSFYLPSTSICSLNNGNAFLSTPIDGYTASTSGVYGSIYVPASLVSAYKVAENWSYHSDRITAIPES